MRKETVFMTNKEIAHKLAISPTALSLVLNNKPGVSDATRERVISELHAMGFSHVIKKNAKQSTNLCFVIYKKHGEILDQHPFFLLLSESIENSALRYGYSIFLMTIDNRKPIQPQIARLNKMDARGAVIFATEMSEEDTAFFSHLNMPCIALDNDFTYSDINTVAINNQMGTFQAITHLVENGHNQIGYLKCATRISSFQEREKGFEDALAHFGLQMDSEYVFNTRYTEEGSYQDFKKYLGNGRKLPTAFVTDVDTIALGVMKAMHEHGILVPKDVSIVGFDDRPACEISTPPLTSVNVPKNSFGAEAIKALMRLIDRQEEADPKSRSIKSRIGTQLIKRSSVKKPTR
jgi:LacI family transcriptional regulator